MSDNNTNKGVHSGHRKRMREKFLNVGASGFQEHELLEMLLYYCYPRINTNVLAHNLINYYGSISALFDAPIEKLIKENGVSENTAFLFKLIPQIMNLCGSTQEKTICYNNSNKIKQLFADKFIGITKEKFFVACLDNDLYLIDIYHISDGDAANTTLKTRSIVDTAIKSGSSYIALAHNHPNGDATPSAEDISTTRQIKEILNAIGIGLLDHIIVGTNSSISLIERAEQETI